ncbi:hypothetical protein MAM1_0032c02457 [Mucor ambiguus]|uniref:Uncharacterized protein n=1 Tax=Mucor ambiguus TaxID=91626 RepID=A0A0C9MIR9_9FUNG|nr:hypothetical protein MAM1_0032c02457 [Mucor ambiguus]
MNTTTSVAITMVAKVVFYFTSNPGPVAGDEDADKSAQGSLIDLPSDTTIQTTTSIYSKTPNGLLFDFSELNMRKEQIIPFIKASLPSNVVACIRPIDDLLAEITIWDQGGTNSLHKMVHSILKSKGLHLKNKNIWLKPTQTLTLHPNLVSWQLRLSAYPKSMRNDVYKQKIAHTIKRTFGKRGKENYSKSVLVVDAENVLFSNYESNPDFQHCSIIILVKEFTIIPPPSINPIRKLIYVSFLKNYLPIEISLVK